MDKINQAISDRVKSGSYFVDSRNWYLRRFTYPIVERSYIGAMTAAFTFVLLVNAISLYLLFPTVSSVPIIINMEDSISKIAFVKGISEKNIETEESIKKFLLKRFLINRESYNFDNMNIQLNIIKNSSLKSIYKDFSNYLSPFNPNSPALYQKHISRDINIISIMLDSDSNNAIIKYKAKETNNQSKISSENMFIANISFQIEDIGYKLKNRGDTNLNFIVTDYQSEQIK